MLSNKIFINALIVSVLFHIFLLVPWPQLKNFAGEKPKEPIKLTYYSAKKIPIDSKLIAKVQTKKYPLPSEKRQLSAEIEQQSLARPLITREVREKVKIRASKVEDKALAMHLFTNRAMLISHKEKDLSSEPVYLNYYNAIRLKIYKRANANKPYYSMEGVVRLIFTLAKNGRLLSAGIIKNTSTRNPILRKHALTSIKKAAPFPAFHESIKEQQLTLRLTISFEK
jgi:TonB family protein